MNQVKKILSIIVIMIAMMSITLSVNAYTNNDVISYVTREHTVNGRTASLNKTQRQSLTTYLTENPVTDSEADEIIAKLDRAKALIDNSGVNNLTDLSDSIKAEVVSLVKSAGAIADLEVEIDTVKEIVTIKDKNGKVIIGATSYTQFNTTPSSSSGSNSSSSNKPATSSSSASSNKLVYTGNVVSVVVIKTILAIVAIAIIVCLIRKNQYAK